MTTQSAKFKLIWKTQPQNERLKHWKMKENTKTLKAKVINLERVISVS